VRENYKLHYYFGYPEVPADGLIRLFDIQSDPEEMIDLAQSKPETASELLNELKTKLKQVNEPYL
jgi:arylsulfatase A-like enzyme